MDNLRAGARELAEQSLEKAYADVLENYLTYSASGGDVQKVFATRYMDGLQKQFAENHTDPAVGALDTMDASGNVAYRVSGYDTDTVKAASKKPQTRDAISLPQIQNMRWITAQGRLR